MKSLHEKSNQKVSSRNRQQGWKDESPQDHARAAIKNAEGKACSVEGCGRVTIAKRLCSGHYQRLTLYGDVQAHRAIEDKSGGLNPKWSGGECRMSDGRVLIFSPNHPNPGVSGKYVLRYRLVMEKHIGRYLTKTEVIHHKNGDCTDDRLENLEITNASEHAKMHGILKLTGRWSLAHTECIECGQTNRKHNARGLCVGCYDKKRTSSRKAKYAANH